MSMTIKALAENLNVSKTTITKIIKKLNIEPDRMEYNHQQVIFLSDDEAELIRAEYNRRHPGTTPTANSAFTANGSADQNANSAKSTNVFENSTNDTKNTAFFTANEPQNTENKSNNSTENSNKSGPDNNANDANSATIRVLTRQLEEKDKQIANLTQALMQEQQLHARTQNQLLELKKTQEKEQTEPMTAEPVPEPQEEKKGFWQRLFNK